MNNQVKIETHRKVGKDTDSGQNSSNEGESKQDDTDANSVGEKESKKEISSMQANNVLSKNIQINWDEITNKTENLYTTWTAVSLDLQEMGLSQELINEFANKIDIMAKAVQDRNKNDTLESAIDLYSYLPKFVKSDSNSSYLLDTKYKLLLCYKYADMQDWEAFNKRN